MHDSSSPDRKLDAWKVNQYALSLYKKYFLQVVIVGFIMSVLYILPDNQPVWLSLILNFVLIAIGYILFAITILFVDQCEHGNQTTILDSAIQTSSSILVLSLSAFVLYIIASVGVILLIIPGIIFGLMFSQVQTFIILNKLSFKAAFSSSKNLTHGNLWNILRSYFVLLVPIGIVIVILSDVLVHILGKSTLATSILSMVPYIVFILQVFANPLIILVTYSLWCYLNSLKANQTT